MKKKKHTYNSYPVIWIFMSSLLSDPDRNRQRHLYNVHQVFTYKTEIYAGLKIEKENSVIK